MIRCLITDGTASRDEARWLEHKAAWIEAGVELLQIRERDLPVPQLVELARKVLRLPNPHGTKILINDRVDVALASGAQGAHLRDESVLPEIFARPGFLISIACHDVGDLPKKRGADYIILAPIFRPLSKPHSKPALGIAALTEFCRLSPAPVLALGGITESNSGLCVDAGAAGIAAISYFNGLPTRAVRPSLRP